MLAESRRVATATLQWSRYNMSEANNGTAPDGAEAVDMIGREATDHRKEPCRANGTPSTLPAKKQGEPTTCSRC